MKFGAQILAKSVPEWKNYNIDYNDLKLRIRITTQSKDGSNNPKLVNELYNSFVEQIDMVSLFLSSKFGEIKRRTVYIENIINEQINSGDLFLDESYESYLSVLSSDLQKLSRFIVVQKTALRKLLKKYTKYSGDNGALNRRVNEYLINNPSSFIHLELTGFYLELTLIYDIIRENQQNGDGSAPSTPSRRKSMAPSVLLNENESFDYHSLKDANFIEKFLVHYDNLSELKLFLLQNYSFVDEHVSKQTRSIKFQKKTSTMSIRQLIGTQNGPASASDNENIPQDNSIYLNQKADLSNKKPIISLILDDPKSYSSIKNQTDPGVLMIDLNNRTRSLLLSAIGGLRKISFALFKDQELVQSLLQSCTDGESYDYFYSKHSSEIELMSSLEKIAIEWIFSKHVKPIIRTSSNISRFTNLMPSSTNDSFWISLKTNIKISEVESTNVRELLENFDGNETFDIPYAFLEVRWNSIKTSSSLQKLLDSHLIYNIDKSFSTLTYSLYKLNKLTFVPAWAQLFSQDIDIRKDPPKVKKLRTKNLKQSGDSTADLSSKPSSVSGESQQFRYWNEFDNGSENDDEDAFLIPIDSEQDQMLSSSSIDFFYKLSANISNALRIFLPFLQPDHQLVQSTSSNEDHVIYGSTDIDDVDAEDHALSIKQTQHDSVIAFLYMSTTLLTLLITGISIGIIFSVSYPYDNVVISPILLAIIITALLGSLFLSIIGLCLLTTRITQPPLWHTLLVWVVFLIVTCLIVGGIVGLFEV